MLLELLLDREVRSNKMTKFDDYAKEAGLNRSQKKFCKVPANKNVRLLAPAGSGKTFSLLWRCKFIKEQAKEKGLAEPHFLIVTFTRAAKLELEDRLSKDKYFKGIKATIRTLNAWGWEQIKKTGKELIVARNQKRTIANHDFLPLYKKYEMIGYGFKSSNMRGENADILMELIDLFKSLGFAHYMNKSSFNFHVRYLKEIGLYPKLEEAYEKLYKLEGIRNEDKKVKEKGVKEFFEFWKKAVILLESENRYTLEDQKYWARIYFEKQLENSRTPQGATRYTHVMVDEFQDINPLDMELIKYACLYHGQKGKLAALSIIGDDDQAIFGWRGTTPKYILQPERYFGVDFVTCVLDTNYRSPKNIVETSNKLLSYNKERVPKDIKSVAKGRATVKVLTKKTVVSSIDAAMKLAISLSRDERYSNVALIGRRQVSLFPYQVLLSAEGVSYYVDSDIDIFYGEAMQSLQNIIQIVYRAKDDDVDDPVLAILNICDKIDHRQLQNADKQAISTYLEDNDVNSFGEALEALKNYPNSIKKNDSKTIVNIINKLINAKSVYKFMEVVEKELHGLEKDYTKKEIDNHYKEPQFFRLKEISKRYGDDFRKFYKDIDKAKKSVERCRKKEQEDNIETYHGINETKIHLMTATRSKGHEYDAVIILDVDEDEWPNQLSDDIEEERRLFYVALSRAKKYLCFVTSEDRLESRFLLESGLI